MPELIDINTAPDDERHVAQLVDHLARLTSEQTETIREQLNKWHLASQEPDRVGSLDKLLWKLEPHIGLSDAMSIVVTIDCARKLYETVEGNESIGNCLDDRVASMTLGQQLGLFDFDLDGSED